MLRLPRGLLLVVSLVAGTSASAEPTTYQEVVAECVTLFTPLVSVADAQTLVPKHELGAEVDVSGNGSNCVVDFREKDWSSDKPGSATPLLMFNVTHGGDQKADFAGLAKMARGMAKKTYADVDSGKFPGVDKAFSYTAFGRHWLSLLRKNTIVTVQVIDTYPPSTLDRFVPLVLKPLDAPGLGAWRERR